MAIVLMPETAVHKDNGFVARKDQVRFPGQVFRMQTVTQPGRMQRLADQQFRLCVASFDSRHVATSGRCVMNIGHASSGFALPCRFYQRLDMRLHNPCNCLEDRYRHRISELLIGLSI